MASLQEAYNYIIQACNDPNIGYSQDRRTTIRLGVDYRTYCDCSSLISWAMTMAGFFDVNPWFATGNQVSVMKSVGWVEYNPSTTQWKAGDVVWRRNEATGKGHTEMVYEGSGTQGRTMGAHTNSYAFPDQVSINTSYSSGGSWMKLLRYEGGDVPVYYSWFQPDTQRYLSQSEMYQNAICFWSYFRRHDYTNEAIAGMMGNIEQESTFNPDLWESLTVGTGGYGLAQWTPATNYRVWASEQGIHFDNSDQNGNGQCRWIDTQTVTAGQWIPTTRFPISWDEFKVLTDVDYASRAFGRNWERFGTSTEDVRVQKSLYWYDQILHNFPSDPGGDVTKYFPWLYGALSYMRRRKLLI